MKQLRLMQATIAVATCLALAVGASPAFARVTSMPPASDDVFAGAPVLAAIEQTGSVGPSDPWDRYRLTLAADDVLTMDLTCPTGQDFDLVLYSGDVVLDEAHAEFYLVKRASVAGTAEETLTFLVPPGGGGDYFVEVNGALAAADGVYSLTWGAAPESTARLSGDDRYQTSVDISRSSFVSADSVVVASGTNFPDALAASGLAGAVGGPVLLAPPATATDDALLGVVQSEITRLRAKTVYVIGGTSAVSAYVAERLAATFPVTEVVRVAGATRYETAALVADKIAEVTGSAPTSAFVVRGDAFADALAVSPIAYARKLPVLLTPSRGLDPDAGAFVEDRGVLDVVVAGGTTAVNESVVIALGELNGGSTTVARWMGTDRYATSVDVAESAHARGWANWDRVGIATGANFPDALSGGAAAGVRGGVLLLTARDGLLPATSAAISANLTAGEMALVFGGPAVVTDTVREQLASLLE